MRLRTAILISLLALTVAGVAQAQLRPEQHIPALPKHKPAPKPALDMDGVNYLSPEDAPEFGKPPRRYRAPEGFAGHPWGETRVTFDLLPEDPLMVRAAWTRGKARKPEMYCMTAALGRACTMDQILNALVTLVEAGGFHVLSEYKIPGQGFKFEESGVVMFPVIYQFCANWDSTKKEVPKDFDNLNRFCGIRMLFQTESLEQLRALPADHVTQYDLVLAELMAIYGKPAGFLKRGRVTIETGNGNDPEDSRSEEDRKFSTWRWCPAPSDGLATSCKASIVMSLDPDSGRAVVLFSTPALWEYAYAREHSQEGGDPLFAVMHALPPSRNEQIKN